MTNWKSTVLKMGLGILASQGIPLDKVIKRPRRSRRRRGGLPYEDLAVGLRDALVEHLTDDELGDLEMFVIALARHIITERKLDEEEEAAPPPRRRKRTAKKRSPARKKPKQ